jgi:NADPH:quinone reductase-like Zn-dependent oxidoreductase
MNPAMSAWIALRRRIEFQPSQSVLILGASGNAGRLAIQVARKFGASSVLAAARDESSFSELIELGADDAFTFDEAARGADVDVVIDYVWGKPTAAAMVEVLKARSDRGKEIKWIQIGSVGGLEAPVPSAALRSARLTIVGSGIGSVPGRAIVEELPDIARAIDDGFEVRSRAVPLSEVEDTWNAQPENGERIVFVP